MAARGIGAVLTRPRLWPDLICATWELCIARWKLGQRKASELVSAGQQGNLPAVSPASERLIARVAWVIPRVAARVPWRADCLVQATAARRWLARHDIATDLWIGTRKDRQGFEAHAWLCHGETVVTGGDVSGFVPLIRPRVESRDAETRPTTQLP